MNPFGINAAGKQPFSRREMLKAAGGAVLLPLTEIGIPPSWAESYFEQQKTAAEPSSSKNDAAAQRKRWVAHAESLKPRLSETVQLPLSIVRPVSDATRYLRWRMDVEAPGADLPKRLLRKGDLFILDFGSHRTGHFQFRLIGEGVSVDSPVRLNLTFGEVPGDVAEPLHPYHGQLSSAWLPEETITIDFLPQMVRMPRRHAFRFVKVEVMDTSPNFGV